MFAQVPQNVNLNEGVLRVKLKPELSKAAAKARLRSGNLTVGHSQFDAASKSVKAYRLERVFPYNEKYEERYRKHGLDCWYEIRFDVSVAPMAALSHYAAIEDVELAEPSFEVQLIGSHQSPVVYTAADLFNDPYLNRQWHYNNTGETSPSVKGADINLYNAWAITAGRPDVIVSVVDGGIDINHNDLKENLWINVAELYGTPGEDSDGNGYIDDIYGVNFIDYTGNITVHEHGTHVAGTIAATNNNGFGVAGVAGGTGNNDGVKVMSCQVFNTQGLSGNFARAIVYGADNGAVISQNSWGYTSAEVYEQVVHDAIDYFIAEAGQYPGSPVQGGVVIFAAGNDGSYYKYYPGAYEPVIAVGAMGPDLKLSSYSNYGDWVDIIAPGGESNHGSTWGVLSTYPDNRYTYMDGTSMACPHVSGIAALVASKYGSSSFTAAELKQRILTATQNFEKYNPGYEGLVGNGYIDAVLALASNGLIAPDQVTDLTVIGIAQDFAQLKWSAVADADDSKANRYELFYSKVPFTADNLNVATVYNVTQKDVLPGEGIEVIIEKLDPLTTYYFAVRAYDRWNNESVLSDVISATTNEGPKFVIATTSASFDVNVSEEPIVSIPFEISNEATGLLRWEATMKHVSQSFSNYSTGDVKPVINLASSMNVGQVKREKAESADVVVKMENSLTEQKILRYGDPEYYVIGAPVPTHQHMAATMFITSTGFNLTDVYAFVKHDEANGPMRIDIIEGNVLSNSAVVYSQEFSSYTTAAYEHRITLNEQVYLPRGAFWINIISPVNNLHPFGIAKEYEVENSSYCFLSVDGGKSFTTVEDAMRSGGFTYPETAVWDVAAVSNNANFGEYITLSPASGTVAGNESSTLFLNGNGAELIQGSYKSNLTFKTNDPDAAEVKCPVTFNVTGQKPNLVSEKIVNFSDVFIGLKKTIDIEVVNEGLAPFVISSIKSNSSAFTITNYNYRVNAHGSINVRVQFAPVAEGSQSATITLTSNTGTQYTFSVYGIGCIEGELTFEPAEIDLETCSADAVKDTTVTVVLKNTGKYPVEYAFLNYISNLDGNLAIIASQVDANAYGYSVEHTLGTEPNTGIVWQEHSDNVTDITRSFSFRERTVPLDLGFSFPLYEQTYDTLYISDCAVLLTVDDAPLGVCYPPMANISCWEHAAIISGCGFQLKLGNMSKVSYSKSSGKAIISYENVGIDYLEFMDALFDMQFVLYENGNIDIVYRNISYDLLDSFDALLIGLSNEYSTDPFTINAFNKVLNIDANTATSDFEEEMGFRVYNPGTILVKSVSEPAGILQINESKELSLNVKLENLSQGNLKQNINILTTNSLSPMVHLNVIGDVNEGGTSVLEVIPDDSKELGMVIRTADLRTTIQISNKGTAPLTITEVKAEKGYFIFEPIQNLVIQPKSNHLIDIICNTSVTGDFADDIIITTTNETVPVHLSYHVIPEPIMEIDRTYADTTMMAGVKGYMPFVFKNAGATDLDLRIEGTTMVYPSIDSAESSNITYIYKRSDEDRSVIYNWLDLKSESTHVQLDYYQTSGVNYFGVVLPFEFSYYGTAYDTLWVHKGGVTSFQRFPDTENTTLITPPRYIGLNDEYNNLIAPMWGYHTESMISDPKETGIFVYKDDNQVVVHWASYSDGFGISPVYDFQMILNSNGNIKFQYKFTRMPSWTSYAVGLENADASDALIISNGKQVLYQSMAIEIIPAQLLVIPANEEKVIDFAIDATGLFANSYYQQVVLESNDPREDAPKSLAFSVELNGEAEMILPELVEFGETIIAPYVPVTESFNIYNSGTDYLMINEVNIPTGASISIDVLEKFTTPWGSFEDYFPVSEMLPIEISPKENKQFRINWESNEPSSLNTAIEFVSSIGTRTMSVTGELVNAPVFGISHESLNIISKDETAIIDTMIVLSNINGESTLRYDASIEFVRQTNTTQSMSILTSPLANTAANELSMCDNVSAVAVENAVKTGYEDFNRVLDYLDEDASPSNFLGFGKDLNFVSAISFTAPADGFQLSHIQTWYRPGDVELSTIYAYILVGNINPGKSEIIGSARMTVETPGGDNVGSFITMELDEVTPIYPGEIFHIMFSYPLGASNPQGFTTVMMNKVENNRYFYADGANWYDLADTSGFYDVAYLMRALEYRAEDNFWVTIDGEAAGSIAAGDEKELTVKFRSHALKGDTQHAKLNIATNDPIASMTELPITFGMNTAPVVAARTIDGVMRMYENEQKEFELAVTDKEDDTFVLELASAPEYVNLVQTEGIYFIHVNADYETAGSHNIVVLARDSWDKESENILKLEITNVNRTPVFEQIDMIEVGIDQFSQELDLNMYFSDPDHDVLKYEFVNHNPETVRVFLSENNMLIKGLALGNASLTVKASDPWGASAEQLVNINVTSSTGIRGMEDSDIIVTPNPVITTTFVEWGSSMTDEADYSIYTNAGMKVMGGTIQKNSELNLQDLENGVYYLLLNDGLTRNVVKIIKK